MAGEELALDEQTRAARKQSGSKATDWWAEARGLFWLVLAVLAFHSFVAKPFYIPSESMMPTLLVGDRLVVTKYPYGYSFVSPTFHLFPRMEGRLFGRLPERGDVVIVTPPGQRSDYIKRVVGLPGETIEMRAGTLVIDGVPVERRAMGLRSIPIDDNSRCPAEQYPGAFFEDEDGKTTCRLPIFRETLPNGRSYDTIDLGYRGAASGDDYGPITVPEGHVFLMGDNRDASADSRFEVFERGLGGPVPWENIGGRAEFITFSLDGSATLNPLSWFDSFRGGRAGTSLVPDREPAG